MIVQTPAIVLRHAPVSNTSRRVLWYTRDCGKVSTIIKGSQRPKSWFLGQYDLFYTCDLVFYPRARRTLYAVRECAPLHMRPELRVRWRAACAASYACDLTDQCTAREQPQPTVFHLLDRFLSLIARSDAIENLIYWFELKMLEQTGLAPRLESCLACGKPLARGIARFSVDRGGLVCGRCQSGGRETFQLSLDAIGILRNWQKSRRASAAASTRCTIKQDREINKLLDLFLRYHLDHPLTSRQTAFAWLKQAA